MLTYIGWTLAGVLVLLLIALVCPVRYRCEAGNQGGFLDIIFFGGLYTKHIRLSDHEKSGDEAEAESAGTREVETQPEKEMKAPLPSSEVPTPLSEKSDGTAAEDETELDETMDGETAETAMTQGTGEANEKAAGTEAPPIEEKEAAPKRPSTPKVLLYAWRNGTIHLLLALLRTMYHHAKPKEFLITGTAGLGDPMETGIAAGLAYAAIPGAIRINWNYTESVCDVTLKAKGRIVPAYLLWAGGRFIMEKPVRETLRYRKMKNEELRMKNCGAPPEK